MNPNGADYDIAGILGYNGRVLGMMPHPERAQFFHHSPLWQINKFSRAKKTIARNDFIKSKTDEGEGIILFKNAINYFRKQ